MIEQNFVPIISEAGYGGVGAQSLAWEGFNAQNRIAPFLQSLARRDESLNQYNQNLAQMQTQENSRRDSMDQRAIEDANRATQQQEQNRLQAGYAAEQARQFDLGQAFKTKELTWKETKDDTERKRGEVALADYALNVQPSVHEAGKALDDAKAAHETAINDFATKMSAVEATTGFPKAKVIYSSKTGQFEAAIAPGSMKKQYELSPAEESAVESANQKIGSINAAAMISKNNLDRADAQWKYIQAKQLDPNRLTVKKVKGTYLVHSSDLGKDFGTILAEAKGNAEPPATSPEGWRPPPGTLGDFLQSQNQTPPGQLSLSAPSSPSPILGTDTGIPPAFGGPTGGTPQWEPSLPSTGSSVASVAPEPFIPNTTPLPSPPNQTRKNITQLPAAGLRAANYVAAGPGSNPNGPGLTLGGIRDAAIGDPNQWAPPEAFGQRPPPVVTTKAQFDSLPPGTVYSDKYGRRYLKPNVTSGG